MRDPNNLIKLLEYIRFVNIIIIRSIYVRYPSRINIKITVIIVYRVHTDLSTRDEDGECENPQ